MTANHGLVVRPLGGPPKSLREEVADGLRAALVAGEMRPGVVYSAPTLAEQFRVSVTPVREALLDLAKEGLVEAVRNRGFRVTELADTDLDEINELRVLIEVPTVARVAARASAEEVEALRPMAEEIKAAAGRKDLIAYVEADRKFHLGLLALAGNSRLVQTVRDLRAQSRLYALPQLADSGQLATSVEEHFALLDAVLRRDTETAQEVMGRHVGHVRGLWAARPDRGI